MDDLRLCKLWKTLLLIEVCAAVSCFSFMDGILPSTVAFDNADNDENQEEEGNGQHHANKPATSSNVVCISNEYWRSLHQKEIKLILL